jgi:type III pantothenate kinase
MLLAIDAGNTNTVFAVHDGHEMRGRWRSVTKDVRTADEYGVWLIQLLNLQGMTPADITGAAIATVVPQALFNLRLLCRRYFGVDALVIGDPGVDLGIKVRVDRPHAVGADRLVNSVSAHRAFGGPLIVIDFGTATTFDIVGPDGGYEGGVIAPGVNLSLEALHQASANLPRIAVERPEKVIGTDTVPAMQSGVYWGYVGLIEGMVARITSEYGGHMKVIATGGLAELFRHGTNVFDAVDGDITIRGLIDIYRHNRG